MTSPQIKALAAIHYGMEEPCKEARDSLVRQKMIRWDGGKWELTTAGTQALAATVHVGDQIDRQLDMAMQGALSIYDVAKTLPQRYGGLADMANHWAHDFVGLARSIKADRENHA